MGVTVKIIVEFNRFDELRGMLRSRAGQIVRKTAFDIQKGYQQSARRDTGAQVNSAYVVTASTSTYVAAVAAAEGANPHAELLPEVPAPDPFTAIVAVGVSYAAVNEFGGHGHAGDGAMTQAANASRPAFLAAMGQLLSAQANADAYVPED